MKVRHRRYSYLTNGIYSYLVEEKKEIMKPKIDLKNEDYMNDIKHSKRMRKHSMVDSSLNVRFVKAINFCAMFKSRALTNRNDDSRLTTSVTVIRKKVGNSLDASNMKAGVSGSRRVFNDIVVKKNRKKFVEKELQWLKNYYEDVELKVIIIFLIY